MNGYVEAGYTVVGVTLAAYTVWILLRSRSIAKVLPAREPTRRGPAPSQNSQAAGQRPATGLGSPSAGGGRGWGPDRGGEAAGNDEEGGWR